LEAGDGYIWGSVGIIPNSIENGIRDLVRGCIIPIHAFGKNKLTAA